MKSKISKWEVLILFTLTISFSCKQESKRTDLVQDNTVDSMHVDLAAERTTQYADTIVIAIKENFELRSDNFGKRSYYHNQWYGRY